MEVTEFSPLLELQAVLEEAKYDTGVLAPGENTEYPFEQLFIFLDEQTWGPNKAIHIFLLNDLIEEAATAAKLEEIPYSDICPIQFNFMTRLKIPKERAIELAELLSLFNYLTPMGFWGWNEQEGVYLRYILMALDETSIDSLQVIHVLEKLQFFARRLLPALRIFATQKAPLPVLIKKVKQKYGLT